MNYPFKKMYQIPTCPGVSGGLFVTGSRESRWSRVVILDAGGFRLGFFLSWAVRVGWASTRAALELVAGRLPGLEPVAEEKDV